MEHSTPIHRVLRSWRSWAPPAAGAWSALVAGVGALWATDVLHSPLGRGDPRAGEVGSYFEGLEPAQTGLVVCALGAAGMLTALAVLRLPGHRWPAIPAVLLSGVLTLVVPDMRVIQNFAYLFLGYTGLWDAGLGAMLVSMGGGVLWGLTAARSLTLGAPTHGAADPSRWAVPVTYAAALCALPYPLVRIGWGLGIPVGVPADYIAGFAWEERLGIVALLGGLPICGAILTLGLIRPWGEVFPRWIPGLRGRRVPILLAVIPGAWAAVIIAQMGIRSIGWGVSWDTWGTGAPGLAFLPWGLTLGAAVYAYAVRRRRQDAAAARHGGGADGPAGQPEPAEERG